MSPWLLLTLLGAWHGVNPAMGWLFAVARGLQEQRRSAVYLALLPIALGHAASVALAVAAFALLRDTAPALLRWSGVSALIAFGLFKLLRPRSHPRWVGMRVSAVELTFWSFLMSSAHGAGLMLLPVMLLLPGDSNAAHQHAGHLATDARAVALHTLVMFVVMTAAAVVVYEKVGVAVLRRAWVNMDVVWAVTIVVAGVAAIFA